MNSFLRLSADPLIKNKCLYAQNDKNETMFNADEKIALDSFLRKKASAYAFFKWCVRGMEDLSIDSELNTDYNHGKKSTY